MAQFYLDTDTTPASTSGYRRGTFEAVKLMALDMVGRCESGQIGIYHNHVGSGFKGYAIKQGPGETPYFEEAAAEAGS